MSRWEPNPQGRLEQAALELFAERGYDQTTVQDIAERAGLTKRTFFRHFADKREALFGGGEGFKQRFVDGLAAAPPTAGPLEAVGASLEQVAAFMHDRRAMARRRHAVVSAHAELREREFVKLAGVAAALAEGLRERGVPEPAASVAAETAVVVFRTAFERWATASGDETLAELIDESLDALQAVTGVR